MIESRPDDKDKRSRRIMLTAAGRAKLRESLVLWENAQSHIEEIFGTREARKLRTSLDVLSSEAFSRAFEMLHQQSKSLRKRSS